MPFVALEGVPGSGKTTIRDIVLGHFRSAGRLTHHVGQHGWLSPEATQLIVGARRGSIQLHPEPLVAALAYDKTLHFRANIEPFVGDRLVLADRYSISDLFLLAATGAGGYDEYVSTIPGGILPQITFIIMCSPDIAQARLQTRASVRFLDAAESSMAASQILSTNLPARVSQRIVVLQNNEVGDDMKAASFIISEIERAVYGA
ncbi:MAG: hypothetical protein WDO17_07390 [Alphaproteobacteria bacterium]